MVSTSDIPWREGGAYGAVAYVGGLVITMTVFYLDHLGTTLDWGQDATLGESLVLMTTIFYNAHFVASELGATIMDPCVGVRCLSLFNEQDILFGPIYYVIPPLFLLLMGALVVYATDVTGRARSAIAGASVVIGYFALAIAVVLALRFGVGFELDIVATIAAGLGYPVVFGAVGGLVANEVVSFQDN